MTSLHGDPRDGFYFLIKYPVIDHHQACLYDQEPKNTQHQAQVESLHRLLLVLDDGHVAVAEVDVEHLLPGEIEAEGHYGEAVEGQFKEKLLIKEGP
jgi:hypothetical protein